MRPGDERGEAGARDGRQMTPDGVGALLRNARKTRRLSLEQVAAELRMEPRLLVALEEDRFEELGPPVFVKGYLRQYGQRLGIDYEDLHARYRRQATPEEVPIVPRRSIELGADRRILQWGGAAAAVVALALVAGWLLDRGAGFELRPWARSTTSEPDARAASDQPAAGDVREPSVEPARDPFVPQAAAPQAAPGGEPPAVERAEPAGVSAQDVPAPAPSVDEAPPEVAAPFGGAAADETSAPEAEAGSLLIEMSMAEDCWTEVTDAQGERLFYGLVDAGQSVRLAAHPPVSLLLGNANAVRLSVDGRPYAVPREGRRGNMVRFTVYAP